MQYIGGMKNESHKGNERVFSDRGREGLFLRAFGKEISVEDTQKIVDATENTFKELEFLMCL